MDYLVADETIIPESLQAYYEGIVPLIDGLVESYQGKNGIIMDYTNFNLKQYQSKEQVVAYLETLCEAAYQVHGMTEDSYLQNQIDTITELIKSTIYKISYLK
jgi:predicted O-linked N-acetylglucosamine transferase (SPINDLY family)